MCSSCPGPGSYDAFPDVGSDYIDQCDGHTPVPISVFASNSPRDLERFLISQGCHPDEPSPGHYDTDLAHDCINASKADFASETPRNLERFLITQGCSPQEPSVGHYDIRGRRYVPQSKASFGGREARFRFRSNTCEYVGPGVYDPWPEHLIHPELPMAVFASESRRELEDFQIVHGCHPDEPSPGYYNTCLHEPVSQGKAPFDSRLSRFTQSTKSEHLGPGTYNPHQLPSQQTLPRWRDRTGPILSESQASAPRIGDMQSASQRSFVCALRSGMQRPMSAPSRTAVQCRGAKSRGDTNMAQPTRVPVPLQRSEIVRTTFPSFSQVVPDSSGLPPPAGSALELLLRHRRTEDRPRICVDI